MFQAMPDLALEPLGRMGVADLGHVVRSVFDGHAGDAVRFTGAGIDLSITNIAPSR